MKGVEIGGAVALLVAVAGAFMWLGGLKERAETFNPDVIRTAQQHAIQEIEKKAKELAGAPAVPVGTVIASAIPPERFRDAPGYAAAEWAYCDGSLLPSGTAYERITGSKTAPNLLHIVESLAITSIVSKPLNHGTNIAEAVPKPASPDQEWHWTISGRETQGRTVNNDWEQDTDKFEVQLEPNGAVVARGSTYNRKHGRWGDWSPGTANVFGVASKKAGLYYYVRIN